MTRFRSLCLCVVSFVAGAASWQQFGAMVLPTAPVPTVAAPAPPPATAKDTVIIRAHQFEMIDGKNAKVMTWTLAPNGDVIVNINDHGVIRRVNLTELSRNRWL
jgi:hypothetical protein